MAVSEQPCDLLVEHSCLFGFCAFPGLEWAEQKERSVGEVSLQCPGGGGWTVAQNGMLHKGLTTARMSLQIHWEILIAGDDLGFQKG